MFHVNISLVSLLLNKFYLSCFPLCSIIIRKVQLQCTVLSLIYHDTKSLTVALLRKEFFYEWKKKLTTGAVLASLTAGTIYTIQ